MNETKMSKRDKLILSAFLPLLAIGLYWHFSVRPLARETRSLRETLATLGSESSLETRKEQLKTQGAALKEKLAETSAQELARQQPPPETAPQAGAPQTGASATNASQTSAPALKRVQDLFRGAGMILVETTADSTPQQSDPIRADIAATLIKSGIKNPQRWRVKARGSYASALRVLSTADASVIIESASFAPAGATDDGSREWTFSFFL